MISRRWLKITSLQVYTITKQDPQLWKVARVWYVFNALILNPLLYLLYPGLFSLPCMYPSIIMFLIAHNIQSSSIFILENPASENMFGKNMCNSHYSSTSIGLELLEEIGFFDPAFPFREHLVQEHLDEDRRWIIYRMSDRWIENNRIHILNQCFVETLMNNFIGFIDENNTRIPKPTILLHSEIRYTIWYLHQFMWKHLSVVC